MKKNTKGTGHQTSFFYRCSLCAAGGMLMGVAAVLFLAGGNGADSMNTLLQGMSQALQLSVDACNICYPSHLCWQRFLSIENRFMRERLYFPLFRRLPYGFLHR